MQKKVGLKLCNKDFKGGIGKFRGSITSSNSSPGGERGQCHWVVKEKYVVLGNLRWAWGDRPWVTRVGEKAGKHFQTDRDWAEKEL